MWLVGLLSCEGSLGLENPTGPLPFGGGGVAGRAGADKKSFAPPAYICGCCVAGAGEVGRGGGSKGRKWRGGGGVLL